MPCGAQHGHRANFERYYTGGWRRCNVAGIPTPFALFDEPETLSFSYAQSPLRRPADVRIDPAPRPGWLIVLTFSLQSGSNGNSIYVEAAGTRLLFDAGISGRQAMQRMATHGRDIRTVHALILSHEHEDHVRSAGAFHRLFGIPVHVTRKTHYATRGRMGKLNDIRWFESGETLEFGAMRVHTFRTPHDATDTVMFVVECEGRRLGIFTDLGRPTPALAGHLAECHAAYLESNYDPEMLELGSYPEELKRRIRGGRGHLSNGESAGLLKNCRRNWPRWIALAHLSEHNNHPDLALSTHRDATGRDFPYFLASRYAASDVMTV